MAQYIIVVLDDQFKEFLISMSRGFITAVFDD